MCRYDSVVRSGRPGGPELLILLLVVAIYIPVLVIVAVYNVLDGKRGYERRSRDSSGGSRKLETERS